MSRQGRFLSTPLELLSQSLAKTSSMMFRFMEDKYEGNGGSSAPVSERRIDDGPALDDLEDGSETPVDEAFQQRTIDMSPDYYTDQNVLRDLLKEGVAYDDDTEEDGQSETDNGKTSNQRDEDVDEEEEDVTMTTQSYFKDYETRNDETGEGESGRGSELVDAEVREISRLPEEQTGKSSDDADNGLRQYEWKMRRKPTTETSGPPNYEPLDPPVVVCEDPNYCPPLPGSYPNNPIRYAVPAVPQSHRGPPKKANSAGGKFKPFIRKYKYKVMKDGGDSSDGDERVSNGRRRQKIKTAGDDHESLDTIYRSQISIRRPGRVVKSKRRPVKAHTKKARQTTVPPPQKEDVVFVPNSPESSQNDLSDMSLEELQNFMNMQAGLKEDIPRTSDQVRQIDEPREEQTFEEEELIGAVNTFPSYPAISETIPPSFIEDLARKTRPTTTTEATTTTTTTTSPTTTATTSPTTTTQSTTVQPPTPFESTFEPVEIKKRPSSGSQLDMLINFKAKDRKRIRKPRPEVNFGLTSFERDQTEDDLALLTANYGRKDASRKPNFPRRKVVQRKKKRPTFDEVNTYSMRSRIPSAAPTSEQVEEEKQSFEYFSTRNVNPGRPSSPTRDTTPLPPIDNEDDYLDLIEPEMENAFGKIVDEPVRMNDLDMAKEVDTSELDMEHRGLPEDAIVEEMFEEDPTDVPIPAAFDIPKRQVDEEQVETPNEKEKDKDDSKVFTMLGKNAAVTKLSHDFDDENGNFMSFSIGQSGAKHGFKTTGTVLELGNGNAHDETDSADEVEKEEQPMLKIKSRWRSRPKPVRQRVRVSTERSTSTKAPEVLKSIDFDYEALLDGVARPSPNRKPYDDPYLNYFNKHPNHKYPGDSAPFTARPSPTPEPRFRPEPFTVRFKTTKSTAEPFTVKVTATTTQSTTTTTETTSAPTSPFTAKMTVTDFDTTPFASTTTSVRPTPRRRYRPYQGQAQRAQPFTARPVRMKLRKASASPFAAKALPNARPGLTDTYRQKPFTIAPDFNFGKTAQFEYEYETPGMKKITPSPFTVRPRVTVVSKNYVNPANIKKNDKKPNFFSSHVYDHHDVDLKDPFSTGHQFHRDVPKYGPAPPRTRLQNHKPDAPVQNPYFPPNPYDGPSKATPFKDAFKFDTDLAQTQKSHLLDHKPPYSSRRPYSVSYHKQSHKSPYPAGEAHKNPYTQIDEPGSKYEPFSESFGTFPKFHETQTERYKPQVLSDSFGKYPHAQVLKPDFDHSPFKIPSAGEKPSASIYPLGQPQVDKSVEEDSKELKEVKVDQDDDRVKHYLKNPYGSDFIRLEVDVDRFQTNKSDAVGVHHIPLMIKDKPTMEKLKKVFKRQHPASKGVGKKRKRKLVRKPAGPPRPPKQLLMTSKKPSQNPRNNAKKPFTLKTIPKMTIQVVTPGPKKPRRKETKTKRPRKKMNALRIKDAMGNLPHAIQNLPGLMHKLMSSQASWLDRTFQGRKLEAAA